MNAILMDSFELENMKTECYKSKLFDYSNYKESMKKFLQELWKGQKYGRSFQNTSCYFLFSKSGYDFKNN